MSPGLPAKDLWRARTFYEETVGLPVKYEADGNIAFQCGHGTILFVYASEYAGTNQATAAGWTVDDIEAVMEDLRSRGVTFEEYDTPNIKTVDGVATFGSNKVAYFKDTEGNILSLAQAG